MEGCIFSYGKGSSSSSSSSLLSSSKNVRARDEVDVVVGACPESRLESSVLSLRGAAAAALRSAGCSSVGGRGKGPDGGGCGGATITGREEQAGTETGTGEDEVRATTAGVKAAAVGVVAGDIHEVGRFAAAAAAAAIARCRWYRRGDLAGGMGMGGSACAA